MPQRNAAKRVGVNFESTTSSLIERRCDSGVSKALARAVIGIADALNFKVLAEGVELDAHRHFLMKPGFTVAQGFLYSPTIAGGSFVELLRGGPGGGRLKIAGQPLSRW